MKKKLALFLAFLTLPVPLFAWGFTGHHIVADIAAAHLSPAAKAALQSLLGDQTLASISTWADEVRPQRPETYNWHFVDIPAAAQGYDAARDCRPSPKGDCVIAEIERARAVLADAGRAKEERVEALKFLVHFVGDIHQPFHAIGEARGGNDIHVLAFGANQCGKYPCNLHFEWDSGLIEHTGFSEIEYVAHLEQLIQRQHLTASGSPVDWANESHDLARQAWLDDGGSIDEKYYREQIKVVDLRLALAGLRLAKVLNEVFSAPRSAAAPVGTVPSDGHRSLKITSADPCFAGILAAWLPWFI
jgi:hypothetical protein